MDSDPSSSRSRVRRISDRGRYDRTTIDAILDEALICHVGFVDQGQPFVIPTIHARSGDELLLHGSRQSRMLACLAGGAPACITVSILDGLVLARSVFHHSMNYRSVVVLGTGRLVDTPAEKRAALTALVERLIPGRSAEARAPSDAELNATWVVAFPLSECSAKIRTGPPKDNDDDYDLPVWAGVVPVTAKFGPPVADPDLAGGIDLPDYIRNYRR